MMRECVVRLSPAYHLMKEERAALSLLYPLIYNWIGMSLDYAGYLEVTYSIKKFDNKGELLLPEISFQADEAATEGPMMIIEQSLSQFTEIQIATDDHFYKSPVAERVLKLILEKGSGRYNIKIFNIAVGPRSPSIQRITV